MVLAPQAPASVAPGHRTCSVGGALTCVIDCAAALVNTCSCSIPLRMLIHRVWLYGVCYGEDNEVYAYVLAILIRLSSAYAGKPSYELLLIGNYK